MSQAAENILVVGPSWVGDMVMAQTLFKTLKQEKPDCQIDVLAPSHSGPILARMPEVRAHLLMPLGHGELNLSMRYRMGRKLKHNYDRAIVLPNSLKSALVPFWAKIPKRTGWLGEFRYGLLNDSRQLDKEKYPLMIERFIALAYEKWTKLPDELPKPKLVVHQEQARVAAEKLGLNTETPVVALCPGAEFGPAKRWPSHHFAEVALKMQQKGYQVWLFGSKKEADVSNEIRQFAPDCVDLTGKTNLAEAIDLLSLASAVVSNDSGLMHIAASLDKPLVVVYGSSSPKFTPPLGDAVKILQLGLSCSPCFKRKCPLGHLNCLVDLKSSMVLQALNELIPA